MHRFPVKGWAASELDIRSEVTAVGESDYALLAAWDGEAVCVFDLAFAERLAEQATELSNALDLQLHEGEVPREERRPLRYASLGLGGLAGRLRAAHAQASI